MVRNEATGDMEMTAKEAAEYLGTTVGSLANDRVGKRRIPFIKILGKVRYRLSDLEALKQYHPAQA